VRVALSCSAIATAATLGGCGGSSSNPKHQGRAPNKGPVLVAALGDSITAGNPGYDPSPQARAALGFGHDPRSQYEYWAHRDEPRLRFRNCGVYGQPTSQMATRLRSCARGADMLIVQGGINDIAQSLQGPAALRRLAVTNAATNMGRMVEQGKQLGLRVVLANVLPWNRGYPVAAPLIDRLNRLIQTTAELEQVQVLPFNRTLASTENPNLMKRHLTADGDHPSIAGYRRLGAVVANRLG
jgi:lysophospholipase L1-like esterase